MGYEIAIVGSGNLGLRYLQGVLGSSTGINVWVVDTSLESLARARRVVVNRPKNMLVNFVVSPRELPRSLDLVVSATTADSRATSLREMLEVSTVRYLILEKVLAQSISDTNELRSMTHMVERTWVNYARRAMTWHQELCLSVREYKPLQVHVKGTAWGLMTNSLHFIDLLEWWTKETAESIQVMSEGLQWLDSKRRGFSEAEGKIRVTFSNGSCLILECTPASGSSRTNSLEISGAGRHLMVDEISGIASGSMLNKDLRGKLELQSELTLPLVERILREGECDLPTFDSVSDTHKLFIGSVLENRNGFVTDSARLEIT